MIQPFLIAPNDGPWIQIRDANDTARRIFDGHYSRYVYADGRKPAKFIGPGEYMLLITQDARAIFAWRKFKSADIQTGINCAIFHNAASESGLSSDLIRAADERAFERWPGERHYTYVNPRKVRHKRDPGRCFIRAGWKIVRNPDGTPYLTKARRLLVFELEGR